MAGAGKPPAKPKAGPTGNPQTALQELEAAQVNDAGPQIQEYVARDGATPKERRGFNGALCDSRLVLQGGANADLILILRIFFDRVDPTAKGGHQRVERDGNGVPYKLEEIMDQDFNAFRQEACRQANKAWNSGLCLVTPNDFTGFDWPRGKPTVRPNVNCSLRCEFTEIRRQAHVVVKVVAPSYPKDFISVSGTYGGCWDLHDTGVHTRHAGQDPAVLWFNKEDIHQLMVPHETGHLLGLRHIGIAMRVGNCLHVSPECSAEKAAGMQYGLDKSLPMWMARDIMGGGDVVHACNASPWDAALTPHIFRNLRWLPAGTHIAPRALKDIPRDQPTLENSPYQGGFQERGRY